MLKYFWAYNQIHIHFSPHFFYDQTRAVSRLFSAVAWLIVCLLYGRRITLIIHETVGRVGQSKRGRVRHHLDRLSWCAVRRIAFHSQRERDSFAEFYRLSPDRSGFEIWPHEQFMKRFFEGDRALARRSLGLPGGPLLFLCIGFVQPHKGFERPIIALRGIRSPDIMLRIVGSVRLMWDKAHQYAESLHLLADQDPRVDFIEAFPSDTLFDTWLAAADYVIVPYHEVWSSGVAARAKLYNRPLLVADTGALAEQQTEGSRLFRTDEELLSIMREIIGEDAD
jgi:glycosyltransferase involved in cell wall biosynthesis